MITSLSLRVTLLLMQPRRQLAFFATRAHFWLMFNRLSTRTLRSFLQSCFSDSQPPACTGAWGYFSQMQDIALAFVELQEIPVGPSLQPVKVPLNGSTPIWCIDHSSQFCITCKLAEGCTDYIRSSEPSLTFWSPVCLLLRTVTL